MSLLLLLLLFRKVFEFLLILLLLVFEFPLILELPLFPILLFPVLLFPILDVSSFCPSPAPVVNRYAVLFRAILDELLKLETRLKDEKCTKIIEIKE